MRLWWFWQVTLALVVLSCGLGFPVHVVAEPQTLYVQPQRANVRKRPAISPHTLLAVLPQDTPVTAVAAEGRWYAVQLRDGRRGWMHTSVLGTAPRLVPSGTPQHSRPLVRIGIVEDGGPWAEAILPVFEKELRDLLGNEYQVQFPATLRLKADWTLAGVKHAMDRLLAHPQVDVIYALGILASQDVGRRRHVSKPVFAPFVFDAELQRLPQKKGASGVRNLSYITYPSNVVRDLRVFRQLAPFTTITFLVMQGLVDAIPELIRNTVQAVEALDLQVEIVPVGATVDTALAALTAMTQAVYVTPLQQVEPNEFAKLVEGLIARRLPSFSFRGRSEVEQGVLFGLARETNMTRLARRVALNVQRTLNGEDPGTFPVTFPRDERMSFNMATARAIGLSPPWDFLTQMDLVHDVPTDIQRQLSLATAVQEAVNANLDLQAVGRFVAAGKETIQEAQAVLLPQIEVVSDARMIDADRAEAGGGGLPERQLSGSITLFQLLYDEPSWANLSIQSDLQSGRQEERHITLLDVVLETTISYLNVLRARTSERIQQQNLVLTRTNLELARVRRQIGVARAAEVVRWESQLANNRRTVISAFAQRKQAEIRLNRVLHRPLEEGFRTAEPTLDDPDLLTNFAKVLPYVDNPRYFEIFRNFMVQEGLEAAPELRLADARIRAQERTVRSAKRSFWSPTIALRGRLAGVEHGGAGSNARTVTLGPDQTLQFPQDNAWNWEVGATASLPLFTGGSRVARRTRAREELAQLQVEREATAERIAARIRTALYQAGAAFANIDLAREAAAAAERNYELVLDAYRQGVVSILELLDAQTEALNAKLDAANAVYVYLIDLMEVQRAVGQFDFFVSAGGRKAWFEKLDAFFRASGA